MSTVGGATDHHNRPITIAEVIPDGPAFRYTQIVVVLLLLLHHNDHFVCYTLLVFINVYFYYYTWVFVNICKYIFLLSICKSVLQ